MVELQYTLEKRKKMVIKLSRILRAVADNPNDSTRKHVINKLLNKTYGNETFYDYDYSESNSQGKLGSHAEMKPYASTGYDYFEIEVARIYFNKENLRCIKEADKHYNFNINDAIHEKHPDILGIIGSTKTLAVKYDLSDILYQIDWSERATHKPLYVVYDVTPVCLNTFFDAKDKVRQPIIANQDAYRVAKNLLLNQLNGELAIDNFTAEILPDYNVAGKEGCVGVKLKTKNNKIIQQIYDEVKDICKQMILTRMSDVLNTLELFKIDTSSFIEKMTLTCLENHFSNSFNVSMDVKSALDIKE